jgi:hypothetical protein
VTSQTEVEAIADIEGLALLAQGTPRSPSVSASAAGEVRIDDTAKAGRPTYMTDEDR